MGRGSKVTPLLGCRACGPSRKQGTRPARPSPPAASPTLPPTPEAVAGPPGLAPARIWDGSPREGLGTRVLSLGTASLAANGGAGLGFPLGPFPGADTWPGCDGPFLPQVQIAPAALTGCPRDKGWHWAPVGPGGGHSRPGPWGGAGRWEACRLAISSSQGCDSLGPTNGPETQCPKRATGRGLPGGAGGRGPMMPPPLQSMNYPHSQPAPNPGPTMQPERAGREALASPTQAALQAGGPLVAAAPPRPQFPAL